MAEEKCPYFKGIENEIIKGSNEINVKCCCELGNEVTKTDTPFMAQTIYTAQCLGEFKNCRKLVIEKIRPFNQDIDKLAPKKLTSELQNILRGYEIKGAESFQKTSGGSFAPPNVRQEDKPIESTRTIVDITAEIKFYKAQTTTCILEIGRRLIEAKEKLQHGEWLPWLEKEVEFSERAAQSFMQLAKEYSNPHSGADLPYKKMLALLAVPAEERQDFIETKHEVAGIAKTVDEMSVRQLQTAIKAKDDAEKVANDRLHENLQLKNELHDKDAQLSKKVDMLQKEINKKQKEISDWEKKPIQVAVEERKVPIGKKFIDKKVADNAPKIFESLVDGAVALVTTTAVEMEIHRSVTFLKNCTEYLRSSAFEIDKKINQMQIENSKLSIDGEEVDF